MKKNYMPIITPIVIILLFLITRTVINRNNSSGNTQAEAFGPSNDTASVNISAEYVPMDRGFGQVGSFTTTDMDNNTVTEEIFSKKPVTFIYYWATWCGACRNALAGFPALYEKYSDNVTFITIIDDGAGNTAAESLVAQHLENYVNLLPTAALVEPIRSRFIPTSVIVDSSGYLLIDKIIGAPGDFGEFIDTALEIVNSGL